MKGWSRSKDAKRGAALVASLVVVTIVAMLGAGYLQISSSLMRRQTHAVDDQHAFYLAEAGLAEAFQAVRMGRSGQVGSETDPARHGNGIVWVDVLELEDGSVRLDATGMQGGGRASLSLVVEPIDNDLGFFADEDLVIDQVILVDGWDSEEGSYSEQAGLEQITIDPTYPYLHVDELERIVFYEGTFYRYSSFDGTVMSVEESASLSRLVNLPGASTYGVELDDFTDESWESDYDPGAEYDFVKAYFQGSPGAPESGGGDSKRDDDDDDEEDDDDDKGGYGADHAPPAPGADGAAPEADGGSPSDGGGSASPQSDLGPTTGGGALLGSNGSIHFNLPEGQSAEVWGDVRPGPGRSVTGMGTDVTVTGETEPRAMEVELPEVDVPVVLQQPPVRHDGLLPMLLAHGSYGYESIEVAVDAELVVRGPATLVVGGLSLEPGAILTLDTRGGEVVLYVTGTMDLQPGSNVETTSDEPDKMTVQVSSAETDPLVPGVNLEATSQFHGTIYAPDTGVRIGSDFEIFGGVVAKRIEVGAGAQLHFDSAGFEGSALPDIVGWRVIEVPPVAQQAGDPFRLFGVEPDTVQALSVAHDLGAVEMELEFVGTDGVERSFAGREDQFDWNQVERVVRVDRTPDRPKAEPSGGEDPVEPPPDEPDPVDPIDPARVDVAMDIASLSGVALKNALQAKTPLTTGDSMLLIDSWKLGPKEVKNLLVASTPLDDAPLERLLEAGSKINSKELEDVLLACTPLSPDVLALVESNPAGILEDGERDKVLQANR
ncbi:MAG: pilus assembly PilX N-terminal domain-containing protein [Planctomycetota bacterium]